VTTVLATAADSRYGRWLLNLIGSVQRRSDIFDQIVVYDLGLTAFQRRLLDGVRDVEVRMVPPFVPHWKQGRTWKTWIWTHVEGDTIVWLDAGITVLRPLTDFVEQAERLGYFVASTGVPTGPCTPSEYYSLFDLSSEFGSYDSVSSGILAFRTSSRFYAEVIQGTFEDAVLGHNLGFSRDEVSKLNWGLDEMKDVVVRDCPLFRYDQSLFNVHFYRSTPDPQIGDLHKYAGYRTPTDHPDQVVWNHRRSGDLRFLPRVRYRASTALVGIPWGALVYANWTARRHLWLLQPGFHARVARRFLATGRLRNRRT